MARKVRIQYPRAIFRKIIWQPKTTEDETNISIAYSNSALVSAAIDFVQYDSGNTNQRTSGYVRYNSTASLGPDFTMVGKTDTAINFACNAEPGQVFQLQYCTNVPSTNWFDLGASVTASNSVATLMDNNITNQQRFYRIKRLLP